VPAFTHGEIDEVVRKVDVNGDGTIECDEFMAAIKRESAKFVNTVLLLFIFILLRFIIKIYLCSFCFDLLYVFV